MNILAIDPSYKSTGICFFENEKMLARTTVCACSLRDERRSYRQIFTDINNFVGALVCRPHIAVIEDFAYKGSRVVQLAEVVAIIKMAIPLDIPIVRVHQPSWASVMKWKSEKKNPTKYKKDFFGQYGIKMQTTDEVDAYLMAKALMKAIDKEQRELLTSAMQQKGLQAEKILKRRYNNGK